MWANNSAPNSYTPITTREIKEVMVKWEYLVDKSESLPISGDSVRYSRPLTRWEKFKGMDKWTPSALLNYDARKSYAHPLDYLCSAGLISKDRAWVMEVAEGRYSFHNEVQSRLRELRAMAECNPGRDHYVSGSILKLIRKIERIYKMEKSLDWTPEEER